MSIHTQTINDVLPAQLIAKNTYDELGQLISKNVGGTDATGAVGLQKVDYSYNIRGWLKGINNIDNLSQGSDPQDLFAFKINYNTVEGNAVGVEPLYNGNISETYWRTSSDNTIRKYGYQYDNLNRLKNAIYQKPGNTTPIPNSYNESMSYDKNGNIKMLSRKGNYEDSANTLLIDNLNYFYGSNNTNNQLMKVTDATNNPSGFKDDSTGLNDTTDDYAYDLNGNMTRDDNKKIASITYNHLNLPLEIIFTPATPIKKINYLYNAAGQKLKKTVTNGTVINTTDYLSGFQYLQATTAGTAVLKFFPTAEGYVNNTVVGTNNTYNYVFNYTDHLGNVRLSYTKLAGSSAITVMQESHYYPFGLQQSGYNMTKLDYEGGDGVINFTPCINCPNKYKFQSQERQDELGLNWDSFKWRNYDYAIGRFMNIDPLSEKYSYQSHYNFSENRVVDSRELEGLEAVKSIDGKNINVDVRFRAENCSVGSSSPITNQQMDVAVGNFISQSNKSYTGEDSDGNQVNFNFISDNNATLTMEFTPTVSYPEGYTSPENYFEMAKAGGAVLRSDFGNTQTGNMQISTENTFPQKSDTKDTIKNGPGHAGKHEMGHIFGLEHQKTDSKNSDKKNETIRQNVMFEMSDDKISKLITRVQRKEILNTIPVKEP